MLGWFRSKVVCPIDPEMRAWMDFRWAWLQEQFGDVRAIRAPIVLPRADFFPDPFRGTEADTRRMLDRVCTYMDIDPARVELLLYEESDPGFEGQWHHGSAGRYERAADTFRVWVETANLQDPLALIATMAHELGHVHLLGHGRITNEEEDHDPLTDLLTVYFGMGVFTANSVIRERQWEAGHSSGWQIGRLGYLRMPEFGYALARFARLRGEDRPAWARELRLDVRSAFHQAMRLLGSADGQVGR